MSGSASQAGVTVLVTDGEQRSALAVVRSLGRAGYRVVVGAARSPSLAGVSRFAAAEFSAPDPAADPAGFSRSIRAAVQQWEAKFVLPLTEASMLALLPDAEGLGATLPCADARSFTLVSDKATLLQVAEEIGIAIPEQHLVRSAEPAEWAGLHDLPHPLVLKPARSVAGGASGRTRLTVQHAASPADLERLRQTVPDEAYPLLAQQRIVGPGVGIFLLVWDGRTVATFSHRRLREKPPSGGVSVYRESIPADPALVAASRALLERFNWQGVAMIEYKMDHATGIPYLMEINGRFWGSVQLAVDAGVDFPRLLMEAASGVAPPAVEHYRTGVRSRWWWGDVDHLLARLRHGDAELHLPPGSPSRLRAVAAFLRLWRPGDRAEVLRWDDPRPAWLETKRWFRRQ